MIGTKGLHILCELYECDSEILDDELQIESLMIEAALECGAEVRKTAFQKFSPQGVSGVVVISESHLTIHTWPQGQYRYAAIDIFTCGDKINPEDACEYLMKKLKANKCYMKKFIRGTGEIKEINIKKEEE